ncbi:MAG: MFS transporter, partial [Spongiibacteraceae bacterium]|nr:MFS transporter [Spongiibacteraceae bacterium]
HPGPLIVTAVLSTGQSWRLSYLVVGTAQLMLALTFFITRQRWEDTLSANAEAPVKAATASTFETLRQPIVWFGMLMFFFYSGIEIAAAQWSYSLLTLGRGVPATAAGLTVSLYWGSLMLGRILFGFVANRLPLVMTLRLCIIASIAGALLFWLDFSLVASALGLMLIGFCFAPIFATLISLTPARVGSHHAHTAIGFQVAAAALGAATLTGLAGLLTRSLGLEVIGAALLVAAVLLLGCYEAFMRWGQARA